MRAVYTPDILGITVFADICFLIRGFFGIISAFTLRFNLKIHILASCFYMASCCFISKCYMAKCYLDQLLHGEMLCCELLYGEILLSLIESQKMFNVHSPIFQDVVNRLKT